MPQGSNTLVESGKPLVFKVRNAREIGLEAPSIRENRGDALRTLVRSLSVFQKEALVSSARTGATWRLSSDEGAYLNGFDAAPCPLAFLTVGMVSSYMNEITALAKQRGVTFRSLKLTQDNYYTMEGSMPKRTMIGGALPVELLVEADCDLDDKALNDLLLNAVAASPLNGLMRGKLDSLFLLGKNGSQIPTGEVHPIPSGQLLPDPETKYDSVEFVAPDEPIITKIGKTEKKTVARGTAAAGSSLAEEQNRVLNIGGVCTLREDGVKEIIQHTYSPWGSKFRFLSDEAPINGGQGRAPDANSYISAGIGFCFMTQFGRFAKMVGYDLSHYAIAQDSHFSLGGASGGTGKAGEADALETHCYLTTTENDAAALEMLDVAERTCFLHAFCRTDMKTKLKVKRA